MSPFTDNINIFVTYRDFRDRPEMVDFMRSHGHSCKLYLKSAAHNVRPNLPSLHLHPLRSPSPNLPPQHHLLIRPIYPLPILPLLPPPRPHALGRAALQLVTIHYSPPQRPPPRAQNLSLGGALPQRLKHKPSSPPSPLPERRTNRRSSAHPTSP